MSKDTSLPPGVPLFDEDGALSREYLLHRGYCCGNGCRNCPYGFTRPEVAVVAAPKEPLALPKPRVLLCWSSGKDSAWALHVLRREGAVEVAGLLTTINTTFDRVAMHAVRRTLVAAQAAAAGLPLTFVPLPWPCTNALYEAAMQAALEDARREHGITHVAFGDLFLEDIRAYREQQLRSSGLTPLFPLWGLPTHVLARQMVESGLRAHLTCVDPRHLPAAFAGRTFDARLLEDLPPTVDPCGENGEFHTFAFDGPMFAYPVPVGHGEIVERDGFVFADLLPMPE